jgi:hypothetical protein
MMVSFSTSIYERSYKPALSGGAIRRALEACPYSFQEKLLIINNVNNRGEVLDIVHKEYPDFVYFFAEDSYREVLDKFFLKKEDLGDGYVYSIQHFSALYYTKCPFLLHVGEDCLLSEIDPDFIEDSIRLMQNNQRYICSMPSWDPFLVGPKGECLVEVENFYAAYGFTDQVYLANVGAFTGDIYRFYHPSSDRYPKYGGDNFEKRMNSYMVCNDRCRLVHKKSFYAHRSY